MVVVLESGVPYPKSLTFPPPLGTPTQAMGDPGHRPACVPLRLRDWRITDMLQERLGRGDFVMLRPGVGDTRPFYLAKIVGQRETLPSGLAAVRLEYYTPYVDEYMDHHDDDPYYCHYELWPGHDHILASQLPLVTIYYSAIVDRVVMRHVDVGKGFFRVRSYDQPPGCRYRPRTKHGLHGDRYRIGFPSLRAVRRWARRLQS